MTRLLVISPHADDAELGCGGYMASLGETPTNKVHNLVVALGDVFFAGLDRVVSATEREHELVAAMVELRASVDVLYREHDRYLDTLPLARIINDIEVVIADFQPTEILIPLPSSHQDHDVVHRACVAACRPSSLTRSVETIAAYEYPATSWGAGSTADAGRGGMYVEIGKRGLDAKLEALAKHRSQIRPDGHCWSLEAARAMATLRGLESGLDYAELFFVMRQVHRTNPTEETA